MKRFIFAIGMVGLLASRVFAQEAPVPTSYKHVLKFAPMALIEPKSSFELDYEYRFHPKVSVQVDAAFINPFLLEWPNDDFQNQLGYKFRLEPRFFFEGNDAEGFHTYAAATLLYSRHTFDRTRIFGFDCDQGLNCAFTRIVTYEGLRRDIAFHAKIGSMLQLDRGKWMWVDIYWGLGFRHRFVDTWGIPEGAQPQFREWFSSSNNKSQWLPSMTAGAKLCVRLH